MATGGGVEIPIPPSRPTVIRQSRIPDSEDSHSTSARPAPPVPVRPAPSVPARKDDAAPVRPQPPVPGRPSEPNKPPASSVVAGRPPPPIPNRTGDVAPKQANGQPVSPLPPPPPEKPGGRPTEGRKRPEITVVCARPMSEVGFRGQGSSPDQSSSTENTKPKVVMPPRPKNQPPKPDPPLIQFEENTADVSNGLHAEVQESSPRGPPPPVPAGGKPTLPKTASPVMSHSAPERPLPSPRAEVSPRSVKPTANVPTPVSKQPAVNTSESESRPSPVNPKLGVPLPSVPRNPPAPSRPPSIAQRNLHNIEDESSLNPPANKSETNEVTGTFNAVENLASDNAKANGDNVYAVINKQKRPTIIRPGRTSFKENKDEERDKVAEPPKVPPKIAPRLLDLEEQTPLENVNKSNSENTPEFLKLKLKATVQEGTVSNNSDKTTAGSGNSENREVTPGSSPPGVAPKPKPIVLPKPKIAAKPTVAAKPVVAAPVKMDSDTTEKKVPLYSEDNKGLHNDIVEKSKDKFESAKPNRPGSVKRPTIIRPLRPAQWGSSENVRKVDNAGDSDQVNLDGSVDDNVVRTRAQPPLPTKRPVSMSNIPQALAQEAALAHRTSSSHSVKSSFSSSESLGTGDQQTKPPPPRPAARARPVSMAAGDSLKMSVPGVSPRLQQRSQTVSVEKAADKASVGPNRPPTSKPVRNPAMPEVPGGKGSSSDDEDEFVIAQTKPDRPQGPPRPAQRQSMVETVAKKSPPSRPGGPPSVRKMSSPEEQEKDLQTEGVKMRPARPGSKPSRPLSMPVKSVLPSRLQLPKSGASKSKGLPPLPRRPGPGHPAYYHMMCVPHGQALFDYTARQGDELSFKQGDMIILVRAVDTEWVVGKIDETEGMFPRGFVKVLMPLTGEKLDDEDSSDENEEFFDTSPEKPDNIGHGPRCRARFDFDGEGHDDLPFEEGDVIRLLERVGMEWRKGEINGRTGLFPLAFVEVIEDLPAEDGDVSSTHVTALFDFDGEEGDLNFTAGEKIQVKYCVNEEWLFGEIGDRRGQFPIQFIDHVPSDLPPLPKKAQTGLSPSRAKNLEGSKDVKALSQWDTAGSEHWEKHNRTKVDNRGLDTPYCIGTYDFPGQAEGDLSFSVGDRIELVERIDADWLRGRLNGHVGMFPAGFVDVKVDTTDAKATSDSGTPEGIVTVALYDFEGETDNELTFCAGDQLIVQELVEGTTDWRWGVHDSKRGIFPAAFVHIGGN